MVTMVRMMKIVMTRIITTMTICIMSLINGKLNKKDQLILKFLIMIIVLIKEVNSRESIGQT